MTIQPTPALNTDALLEVFSHYTADQKDGIFDLMFVSKAWRSLVLNTPSLWEWIVIDTRDSNCPQKARVYLSHLSDRSPRITLYLPVTNWNSYIVTLLDKCQSCYFEIPDNLRFGVLEQEMVRVFCALESAQVRRIHCPWTSIQQVRDERVYNIEFLLAEDGVGSDHQYRCTYRINGTPEATGDWKQTVSEAKYSAAKELAEVFKRKVSCPASNFNESMEAWMVGPPKRQMEFDMEQHGRELSQRFKCIYKLEGEVDLVGHWKSNPHEARESAAMEAFKIMGIPVHKLPTRSPNSRRRSFSSRIEVSYLQNLYPGIDTTFDFLERGPPGLPEHQCVCTLTLTVDDVKNRITIAGTWETRKSDAKESTAEEVAERLNRLGYYVPGHDTSTTSCDLTRQFDKSKTQTWTKNESASCP